ncbi:MAG TPA: ATP-binding protein [Streptosporangiaceae bacterium]|nr:ATP-binding protein [Streptosporangiaceae bacterium]
MQQTATAPPPAGPARTWEATYPGTADQVRRIRAALRSFLDDCPVADDVILLADELAANAINHSNSGRPGGIFTARAEHIHGDHVWAEIEDQGSATWDGNLSRSARHPHGLSLLLALALRCGTGGSPHARTIWFRIDCPTPGSLPTAPGRPVPEPGHRTRTDAR